VKDDKKGSSEPQLWDMSQFLFQDKLNEEVQENEDYETFPDLEEGFTLRIRFGEGSFGKNTYATTSRIDFKDRDKPYKDSMLDDLPCLDDILEVPSYRAVEALFFGGMTEEELEDMEDDRETTRKLGRKLGAKPVEDEDDEEEEVELPKKSRKKESEPEEEDDEDEDDDEEEVKPARKSEPKKESKKEPKSEEKSGKCPHGHKFGKDCDEYDECDDCKKYDDCIDASS
jgi:hypothetical protein